jgi:hypothetical protein
MKKLFASAFVIASLVLNTNEVFAINAKSTNPEDLQTSKIDHGKHDKRKAAKFYRQNKMEIITFKSIVDKFENAKGEFLNASADEKENFYSSAETLKKELAQKDHEKAEKLLRKIDLTENVFLFVWNSKPEYVEPEFDFNAPELPIIIR